MGNGQSLGDDAKAVYDAARRGDCAEVARLAQLGAGLEWRDAKGRTPLIAAVAMAKHAAVKQLLELGAEPHAVGSTRDVGSALHLAASCGDRASAEALLVAGASPFLVHHGATPLDAAAAAGDEHLCRRFESLGLFAAWVFERKAPGLIDSALGRERWERRYVAVVPRYSAAPALQQGVLCALQLRVHRRDTDAAPAETHLVQAARAAGAALEVSVVDVLQPPPAPPGRRVLLFSCTPPGVFPPEGGSATAAAARMAALLAACTSRAPPRVPLPASAARRSAAGAASPSMPSAAAFPSPPSAASAAAEVAPAVVLAWMGAQPAPRSTRSGAPEAERSWPTALQLRIALPLVARSNEIAVAASGQELTLHAPGKYRLRAVMPFPVAADMAAVFDAERRELTLTLTVLCVPRDPPPPNAQMPAAQPAPPPPPLPPRPAQQGAAEAGDADLEEAIRRSLADVATPPPPPPPPSAAPPPSAPPLPAWAPAAAPSAPAQAMAAGPAAADSSQDDDDATLCVICMSEKRTVGLLHGSSMHVVACAACAPRLQNAPCPMCRTPVERLVQNIYN